MTGQEQPLIESLSAVTLATHDMGRAVRFYEAMGFPMLYGGEDAPFTSFAVGSSFLNLFAAAETQAWSFWGRAIVHVADVDVMYRRALAVGLAPQFPPATPPGANATFTSPTPTATRSVSPARFGSSIPSIPPQSRESRLGMKWVVRETRRRSYARVPYSGKVGKRPGNNLS